MKVRFLAVPLLVAGSALAAQAPATPPPPSFGEAVEVNVVNIEVFVTDRDGKRVTGLRKEDFQVLEDGKAVEVTNFAAVAKPVPAGSGPAAPAAPSQAAAPPPAAAPEATAEDWLNLVVLVDDLHLRPENRKRALEQIRQFLSRNVRPLDRVMLATYDLGLKVRQPFTGDPAALDAALQGIEKLLSTGIQRDQDRRSALRTMYSIHELDPCSYDMVTPIESYAQQTRDQVLRTVGALKFLVNSLAGIPGRKAVLYISDGLPVTPGEELFQVVYELCGGGAASSGFVAPSAKAAPGGGGGSGYPASQALLDAQKYSIASRFADLTAHANANRVTFYTLQASGLRGFASAEADIDPGERALQLMTVQQVQTTNLQNSLSVMAADTGGKAILNANDFLPDLGRMREDFSVYYSLGYTPAHAGDGRQHRVEVKVRKAGLRVRHRGSYRDKPVAERTVDRTLAALFHGIEDNPLDVAMEIGDPVRSEDGAWSVPVHLRIPLFRLTIVNQQGAYQGKLRLLVVTGDDQGGTSAPKQVAVPIQIPSKQVLNAMGQYYLYNLTLKMPAGSQRVAVAVRDELAAATSYLTGKVQVGALKPSTR
ncbi:MAG TPA: VWA domain-containing protein [Thermoanaerobaculia bacterium]|nr:VWA domain-containing protein [Thermoanaerobaculia bacterium]